MLLLHLCQSFSPRRGLPARQRETRGVTHPSPPWCVRAIRGCLLGYAPSREAALSWCGWRAGGGQSSREDPTSSPVPGPLLPLRTARGALQGWLEPRPRKHRYFSRLPQVTLLGGQSLLSTGNGGLDRGRFVPDVTPRTEGPGLLKPCTPFPGLGAAVSALTAYGSCCSSSLLQASFLGKVCPGPPTQEWSVGASTHHRLCRPQNVPLSTVKR